MDYKETLSYALIKVGMEKSAIMNNFMVKNLLGSMDSSSGKTLQDSIGIDIPKNLMDIPGFTVKALDMFGGIGNLMGRQGPSTGANIFPSYRSNIRSYNW